MSGEGALVVQSRPGGGVGVVWGGRERLVGDKAEGGGDGTRRQRVLVRKERREGVDGFHRFKVKLARGLG